MSTPPNDYHISFFKPTTPQAKANRNMVILFFTIWAVAIFGFHIILKIIEKPVPENEYLTFQNVWPLVKSDKANKEDIQSFARSTMSVLGKVMVQPEEKEVLKDGLNWSVNKLADSVTMAEITSLLVRFESLKSEIEDIRNDEYVSVKNKLSTTVSPLIGIEQSDARASILPLELASQNMGSFEEANKEAIESVMTKYMIHNRSVLTDFTFLGFPFHYFYTAVFLLVLFVALCWLYCKRTDKLNKQFNVLD